MDVSCPNPPFSASPSRQLEYQLGRFAARSALRILGSDATWLERDPYTRRPLWPKGFVGSLTHTQEHALAFVAPRPPYHGVGVDLEATSRQIDPRIAKHVCTPSELAELHSLPSCDFNLRLLSIFSAKESLYKCFSPQLPQETLRFQDVSILWSENQWSAEWLRTIKPWIHEGMKVPGLWEIQAQWLLTATWWPALENKGSSS